MSSGRLGAAVAAVGALCSIAMLGIAAPASAEGVQTGPMPIVLRNETLPAQNATLIAIGGSPGGALLEDVPRGTADIFGWDWFNVSANEWYDYRIGNSGWTVRVRLGWAGVDCRFRPNGWQPGGSYESQLQDISPYACLNGAGTGSFIGRGTSPDDARLIVLNKAR